MTTPHPAPHAVVIGGGPAGLMAAETMAVGGVCVTVVDRMPSVGRKFLMAGRGGLNLSNTEPLPALLAHYGAATPCLAPAIEAFPPAKIAEWCEGLGQTVFTGSSGRMFPTTMKSSPLLRAWLTRLDGLGVVRQPGRHWLGWHPDGTLCFATGDNLAADATILAVGGASWPRLGADGSWVAALSGLVAPLRPANCGFTVAWSDMFRTRFEGRPLKRIALRFGDTTLRGEALITAAGIEGGAVYALSSRLRDAIDHDGAAILHVDLRPDMTRDALAAKLDAPRRGQSLSNYLRKTANLPPEAVGLLQEARHQGAADQDLAGLIKAVPLKLLAPAAIGRAISTAGGLRLDELDADFMLHARPGVFAAGEMLDWEAPTGGYLLHACLATGAAAGRGVLRWLGRSPHQHRD